MTDNAAPGTAGQPSDGAAAPRTIELAWYALLTAAGASVLTSLALFGARSWLESSFRDSIAKSKNSQAQKDKDLANVGHTVSTFMTSQLLIGAVAAAILVFLAIKVRAGRPWTRWGVVGAWILLSLSGYSLIGLSALLSVGSSAPALFKAVSFLGAAAFVFAVVAVNLRPSVEFLNRNRPARPAGAAPAQMGLRGLFAPRQRATPSSSATGRTGTRPATTRPAARTPNGRTSGPAPTTPARSKGAATLQGAATSNAAAAGGAPAAKGKERVAAPAPTKPATAGKGRGKAKGR